MPRSLARALKLLANAHAVEAWEDHGVQYAKRPPPQQERGLQGFVRVANDPPHGALPRRPLGDMEDKAWWQ